MPAAPENRILWNATRCARYVGLSVSSWHQFVEARRCTGAPAPASPPDALHVMWDSDEIRAYAEGRFQSPPDPSPAPPRAVEGRPARQAGSSPKPRIVTGRPEPDRPEWTARECADYHGVATRGWRLAVRRGDAPSPVTTTGAATPLWSADAVRDVTCFD